MEATGCGGPNGAGGADGGRGSILGLSGARRFFENWRAALRWQRLEPYEKFAELIERHWDGIAAYCLPENKVSRGFVEGLNNKIRVIQRRAYGLRNAEYLQLKILTCMLPKLRARTHAPAGAVFANTPPHRVAWLVTGPRHPRPVSSPTTAPAQPLHHHRSFALSTQCTGADIFTDQLTPDRITEQRQERHPGLHAPAEICYEGSLCVDAVMTLPERSGRPVRASWDGVRCPRRWCDR